MKNTCFCCGKEVAGYGWTLKNGCLCDDCYEEAKKCSSKISHRNIGLYSGEEIFNIIFSADGDDKTCSVDNITEETKNVEDIATSKIISEQPSVAVDSSKNETKSSPFGTIKKIGWTMVVIVLLISIINPSFMGEIATKLFNKVSETNSNAYIEMVKSLKPYDNTSYFEAFDSEFDNNVWSYFKSNEKHIVQVVSTYNDINDKMITQFLLTPQGNDQFYIEPYAVNVSGTNLSNIERNMVIAALFKGDLSQVLLESLLYGN